MHLQHAVGTQSGHEYTFLSARIREGRFDIGYDAIGAAHRETYWDTEIQACGVQDSTLVIQRPEA